MPIASRYPYWSLVLALWLASACNPDTQDPCFSDRCTTAGSRAELLAELEDFQDPVAAYFRANVNENGTLGGDYRDIVNGVADHLGCNPESNKNFVVLSAQGFVPKVVLTPCSDQPDKASQFFMAIGAVTEDEDLDTQRLHIAAWDDKAGEYRRYSTQPQASTMAINVQPDFCLNCHAGPEQVGQWIPTMNEVTEPWAQWNAEPGFQSQLFDEHLDISIADSAAYRTLTHPDVLESAGNLEPIIRAGLDRVVAARLRSQSTPANLEQSLQLLRPLYCDEFVNYGTEIHNSGELRTSVIVDDALRQAVRDVAGGHWEWVTRKTTRLTPPRNAETPLSLVPFRGVVDVQTERALVSRGVLSPLQALRIRALDWQTPVFSEFRCQMYRDAEQRFARGELSAVLDALPANATNRELIGALYNNIMTGSSKSSNGLPDDRLLVIDNATRDNRPEEMSIEEFATHVQTYADSITRPGARSQLSDQRSQRLCEALDRFANAPLVPGFDCQ